MKQFNELYSYKDIVLIPDYSECKSRDKINVEVDFLGHKFKSPCIPANMATTISFELAKQLDSYNYFYILHRFYNYTEIKKWIASNQDLNCISISLGVKQKDYEFIDWIIQSEFRVDFITIDVASGHNILVRNILEYINRKFIHNKPKIIAGNVMTSKAVLDLYEWGADCLKIGLSMGASCTTYNVTGVGSPMFSSVLENSVLETKDSQHKREVLDWEEYHRESGSIDKKNNTSGPAQEYARKEENLKKSYIPIIADGQIREIGDINKALVAGADMIMIGSMFASRRDSPAKIYSALETARLDNEEVEHCLLAKIQCKKLFFGSASETNKGNNKYIEGSEKVFLDMENETYLEFFDKINQGIKSCMSYAGAKKIEDLKIMSWAIKK